MTHLTRNVIWTVLNIAAFGYHFAITGFWPWAAFHMFLAVVHLDVIAEAPC